MKKEITIEYYQTPIKNHYYITSIKKSFAMDEITSALSTCPSWVNSYYASGIRLESESCDHIAIVDGVGRRRSIRINELIYESDFNDFIELYHKAWANLDKCLNFKPEMRKMVIG